MPRIELAQRDRLACMGLLATGAAQAISDPLARVVRGLQALSGARRLEEIAVDGSWSTVKPTGRQG